MSQFPMRGMPGGRGPRGGYNNRRGGGRGGYNNRMPPTRPMAPQMPMAPPNMGGGMMRQGPGGMVPNPGMGMPPAMAGGPPPPMAGGPSPMPTGPPPTMAGGPPPMAGGPPPMAGGPPPAMAGGPPPNMQPPPRMDPSLEYKKNFQMMLVSEEYKAKDDEQRRYMIGDFIYGHVQAASNDVDAPKITGMIIDLPERELVDGVNTLEQL